MWQWRFEGEQIFEDSYEQKYWVGFFEQMYEDPQVIDTWDFQWLYACWCQSGLVVAPNKNLISNLGCNREDSTHTTGDDPRSKLPIEDIEQIIHPSFVVRHRVADQHSFDCIFGGKTMREQDKPLAKFRRRL